MKASKKVFVAMALAVVICTWGHPVSAEPDQQRVYYNCVDAYNDPLLTCFGDDSCIDEYGDVVNCADISGSQTCQQYLVTCESACSSQESADMNACARIQDPIDQANCMAVAYTTAQACDNACLGICLN